MLQSHSPSHVPNGIRYPPWNEQFFAPENGWKMIVSFWGPASWQLRTVFLQRVYSLKKTQMGVSRNRGTPKSSILIRLRFSIITIHFIYIFGYPYFWKHPNGWSINLTKLPWSCLVKSLFPFNEGFLIHMYIWRLRKEVLCLVLLGGSYQLESG